MTERDASCRRRRRSRATTARPTPAVAAALARARGRRRTVAGRRRRARRHPCARPGARRAREVEDVVVHDGHEHTVDKEASAGIVALRAPDGRTALPVFTSRRDDGRLAPRRPAGARPTSPRAALSAVTEGWEVLVVDPGGPDDGAACPARPSGRSRSRSGGVPAVTADGSSTPRSRDAVRAARRAGALASCDVDAVAGRARRGRGRGRARRRPGPRRARRACWRRSTPRSPACELVATRVDSLELRLRAAA